MAPDIKNEQALDNAVWHALRGPLSRFSASHSTDALVHFDPEVSVFSGVGRINPETWQHIADRVGPEGHIGLFRDLIPSPPTGWEELFRDQCLQMVAGDIAPVANERFIRLGPDDRDDMLALADLTEPGPFALRTGELGRYIGVRREGKLIAMAGERFRLPGYVEISAVCTHPDARGEGLAATLTLDVAHSIRENGDEAFLHVLVDNESAIRLYQNLGFVTRRVVDVVFAQWHGPDWRPPEEA